MTKLNVALQTNEIQVESVFDLVRCVDLSRVVAWIREGVAIFRDAKICTDEDNNVITLGQAAAL
ncbi:MAG: hypothetical protein AAFX06_25045 [Planctomycetota bacterium]